MPQETELTEKQKDQTEVKVEDGKLVDPVWGVVRVYDQPAEDAVKCPKCGKPMGKFGAAFLSEQDDRYSVWLGTLSCVTCNIYLVSRGPCVPTGMDPESFKEGVRVGSSYYSSEEARAAVCGWVHKTGRGE